MGKSCECLDEQLKANSIFISKLKRNNEANRNGNGNETQIQIESLEQCTQFAYVTNAKATNARQKYTIEMYGVTISNSLLSVWQMMFRHTYLADLHVIKTEQATRFVRCLGFFSTVLCRSFAFQA